MFQLLLFARNFTGNSFHQWFSLINKHIYVFSNKNQKHSYFPRHKSFAMFFSSTYFRHPKLAGYKNKLIAKWIKKWKNLYTDYANVGITTYKDCITNPLKSSLILAAACSIYYMKSHNPDELSYRSAVVDAYNRFSLVSNSIRNPYATDYLKMIDKSFSQGLIRHSNCALFSIIWVDDYDDVVSSYKTNCRYLKISWAKIPTRIIDIGFLNQWWILDSKMINYDVNVHEFEKKSYSNFENFQSLNY